MKQLYIQDNGVRGCLIAIATSEEDARMIMRTKDGYGEYNDDTEPLTVLPVEIGTFFQNIGDA